MISFAGLVTLPRPFDTFVNATPGPYAPGGRLEALAFTVSVTVTPLVSATPKAGLAVSHDGVLIEYLTVPVEALTRYSMNGGENGPLCGPEMAMLLEGVTINDAGAGLCAVPICVSNSVTVMASVVVETICFVTLNICSLSTRRLLRLVDARCDKAADQGIVLGAARNLTSGSEFV
jgi:hypothetical protein